MRSSLLRSVSRVAEGDRLAICKCQYRCRSAVSILRQEVLFNTSDVSEVDSLVMLNASEGKFLMSRTLHSIVALHDSSSVNSVRALMQISVVQKH